MKSITPKMWVIGATGYIGNRLFESAKSLGSVLGTSSSGGEGLYPLRLDSPLDFDYCNVSEGDTVFLSAAISAPDVCAREHDMAWSINVTGTSLFISKVIERGAHVIFFSSDTVYGAREELFDESTLCNPLGQYAVMKHEVERRFASDENFKSIRLSYVFSKDDKFTRFLMTCAQNNDEAELFHPFCRAIVHRQDVIMGALALAERWNETPMRVINFGGPQILSRVELAECLKRVHLHQLQIRVMQPDDEFFQNRARTIAMSSPVLERLLGRPPRNIFESAAFEFQKLIGFESGV